MTENSYEPPAHDERCEQLLREQARAQEPDPQFRTELLQKITESTTVVPTVRVRTSTIASLVHFIQHGPRFVVAAAFLLVTAGAVYPFLQQDPVPQSPVVQEQQKQASRSTQGASPADQPESTASTDNAAPAPATAPLKAKEVEEKEEETDDFGAYFDQKPVESGFGTSQGRQVFKAEDEEEFDMMLDPPLAGGECVPTSVCLCRSSINANTYYSCEYGSHIQETSCDTSGMRTAERTTCPFGCGNGVCRTTPNASCGNKIVETGEDCDDGNIQSGDGCSSHCSAEECLDPDGDDVAKRTEVQIYNSMGTVLNRTKDRCFTEIDVKGLYPHSCYDKSGTRGNGDCLLEKVCAGNQLSQALVVCPHGCNQGVCIGGKGTLCGNGSQEKGEECDDGNNLSGDGCNNLCRAEELPDLIIRSVEFVRENVSLQEDRVTVSVVLANVGDTTFEGTAVVKLRTGESAQYPKGFLAVHTQQHSIPSGSTVVHTLEDRYVLPPGETLSIAVQAIVGVKNGSETTTENNSITTALQSEPVVQLCEDSDGGRAYAVAGSASATQGTVTHARDRCRDTQELIEIYCRNDQIAATVRTCLHGCKDGACQEAVLNVGSADLSLAPPVPSNTLVSRGDTVRFTHAISTDGSTEITNSVLELTVPSSLVFDPKESDLFCSPLGNALVCRDVPLMRFFTLSFTVAPDALCPGTITYEAAVSANQKELRPEDNVQSLTLDLSCGAAIADLGITMNLPGIAKPGDVLNADVTVSNAGPDTVVDAIVNLVVPLDLTLLEEAAAGCTQYGTQINCSSISVDANATRQISLPFVVENSADCNRPQFAYATINTTAYDDFPNNNESQRRFVTVVCEE